MPVGSVFFHKFGLGFQEERLLNAQLFEANEMNMEGFLARRPMMVGYDK